MRSLICLGALCLTSAALGYTSSFTLDFNSAQNPASGWTEANGSTVLVAGSTTPADSPAYSPAPNTGAGFNSSGWLRVGATQPNGIVTAIYDGTAGGSTTAPTDYTVEADVFVVVSPNPSTARVQEGLVARWVSANSPLEFFYSQNTPGTTSFNGYGVRNTGTTPSSTYGLFGSITESANRWVHLKMKVVGSNATVSVDRDLNGTDDNTATIALGGAALNAGKAGVFSVINDVTPGNLVPNQYSYFDNFKYTPNASVQDWSVY